MAKGSTEFLMSFPEIIACKSREKGELASKDGSADGLGESPARVQARCLLACWLVGSSEEKIDALGLGGEGGAAAADADEERGEVCRDNDRIGWLVAGWLVGSCLVIFMSNE